MPDLYQARSWILDEPGPPRSYVLHAGDVVLANASRVAVQRRDDAPMPYASPHAQYDETRVVVCVAAPDGAPHFYVDRTNDPMGSPPAFVVAADGTLIGSIVVDVDSLIGGLKGIFSLFSGKDGARFSLLDAQRRQLGSLAGPSLRNPKGAGTVTDGSGTEVARFTTDLSPYDQRRRRHTMQLQGPLPEPLHTLVLASLIGMELLTPA